MVGLKEGKEETGKVIQYMEKILSQRLGLTSNEFEIESAHRSLAPMPNPNEPPRTIMIRFLLETRCYRWLRRNVESIGRAVGGLSMKTGQEN